MSQSSSQTGHQQDRLQIIPESAIDTEGRILEEEIRRWFERTRAEIEVGDDKDSFRETSATSGRHLLPNVRTQSGLIGREKVSIADGSRSPDQFRLSRLKEGERVCGGRGQFGENPLWDFNTDC